MDRILYSGKPPFDGIQCLDTLYGISAGIVTVASALKYLSGDGPHQS